MSRRTRWLAAAAIALAATALAAGLTVALTGDGGSAAATPKGWRTIEVDPNRPYLPTLANAEFAAGPGRISFTITDARGLSVPDLRVSVGLYDLADLDMTPEPPPTSVRFAQFIDYGGVDPSPALHRHAAGSAVSDDTRYIGAGVYVAPVFIPAAGPWGLELAIDDGADVHVVRVRLDVRERSAAPAVGEPAIAVATRTLADEPDLARLTSDPVPEPGLYQLSLDEALARPRPLILIFSTPAFCHSRTCGPALDVVKAVWRDHAREIDAIHVEVFENPNQPEELRESPAFVAWRLPSEPWVFVIDAAGVVVSRYEGSVTEAELRGDVAAALAR